MSCGTHKERMKGFSKDRKPWNDTWLQKKRTVCRRGTQITVCNKLCTCPNLVAQLERLLARMSWVRAQRKWQEMTDKHVILASGVISAIYLYRCQMRHAPAVSILWYGRVATGHFALLPVGASRSDAQALIRKGEHTQLRPGDLQGSTSPLELTSCCQFIIFMCVNLTQKATFIADWH